MSYSALVKPTVHDQPVYAPGKPSELLARERGLDPAQIVKLASNENPLGPSPAAVEAARAAIAGVHRYPENSCHHLRQALASRLGVDATQLIFGAGSSELFLHLGHAVIAPGTEVVFGDPAFVSYRIVTLLFGGTAVAVPLRDHVHDLDAMQAAITGRTRLVFLPTVNNPTGTALAPDDIVAFVEQVPDHVLVVVDDAYHEYLEATVDIRPLLAAGRKVMVTRTFSKIFGLAGLRVGYGLGAAAWIDLLERVRPPFNVSSVGQAAALAALGDAAWVARSKASNAAGLAQLEDGLRRLGVPFVPSAGNFLLVRTGAARATCSALESEGLIVRPVAGGDLGDDWLRLSVGTGEENARLLAALPNVLTR